MAEERIREEGERPARVINDDQRRVGGDRRSLLFFSDNCRCALLYCLRNKLMAVRVKSPHGHEQEARLYLPGIMGDVLYLPVQPARRKRRLVFQHGQKVAEFHRPTRSILPPLSSGATCRYARLCSATALKTGPATLPP